MRPTNRLFLFLLIFLIVSGTAPAVKAQTDCTPVTAGTSIDDVNTPVISCADPPICYSDSISEVKDPYQINYYKFTLGADQKLIIDVDAETNDSSLDALLAVFETDGTPFLFNNDQMDKDGKVISLDPYLEFAAPPDGDVTYLIAISAGSAVPTDPDDPSNKGTYTFSLQCSDETSSLEFKWPVAVPDLLGATGSNPGSLINITPENAGNSLPFPLGVGPIADIEFDPTSDLVFVAVDVAVAIDDAVAVDAAVALEDIPAKIVALDPISGNEVESYSLETESVVALEAAENQLYGVKADPSSEQYSLVLVTFDDSDPTDPTATLTPVFSFGMQQQVQALAYHQSERVMYAASGTDLLKINLALSPPVDIQEVVELPGLSFEIASMDFSHEDVLYVVDVKGNLFRIDLTTAQVDLTTAQAVFMGVIDVSAEVSGLTFVVGEPPDDEPVKIICSSTLASQMAADSASGDHKLSKFKQVMNRLSSGAVGLFKFQAAAGENIIIRLMPEVEEVAATDEESAVSELETSWPRWHWRHWKGEGRLFLGLRDAIPGVKRRERTKGTLPLELAVENLAEGQYYIMVIQPLFRYKKVDYCLTMESDYDVSQAWESLEVAWPHDDSDDDTASTSAAEPENVQKSTETVASASADDSPVPVALSTTAVNEPDADGGSEDGQTLAETPVVELVAKTPVVTTEPVAKTPVVTEPVVEKTPVGADPDGVGLR